jgi:hypothetical protein
MWNEYWGLAHLYTWCTHPYDFIITTNSSWEACVVRRRSCSATTQLSHRHIWRPSLILQRTIAKHDRLEQQSCIRVIGFRKKNDVVSIMIKVRSTRSGLLIPAGTLSFSSKRSDGLWGPRSLLFNGHLCPFPGPRRLGLEIDHSPGLRMSGGLPLTPPYALMAWTGTSFSFTKCTPWP